MISSNDHNWEDASYVLCGFRDDGLFLTAFGRRSAVGSDETGSSETERC
jgi:hypothetical protein